MPGDILLIPPNGCILQCDAIIMNGTVIVNESVLTGESVPITKVALSELDDEEEELTFLFREHSKHVLYCGTKVLQTRFYGGKYVQVIFFFTFKYNFIIHYFYFIFLGNCIKNFIFNAKRSIGSFNNVSKTN